jgi:hypothetical protein
MLTLDLTLAFVTPYVGHPYWTEVNEVIEITKKSGMNRAKSDANRRKSLEEYLRANNMTLADFERLDQLSRRPFHFAPDGEIIIPADRILSFLVAANSEARAANRATPPEQVRSRIAATDFHTGKYQADGVWKRFAQVNLGNGAKASNQRGLRENPYIADFEATGALRFDEQTVDPKTLIRLIEWAGEFVGIGASRKMGKGRFRLARAEIVPVALAAE